MRELRVPTLYNNSGLRKYLSPKEAVRFLEAVDDLQCEAEMLCRVLYWTGCRISEALELGPDRIDEEGGRIVLRTLKRRRRDPAADHAPIDFRAVPVSFELIRDLARLPVNEDGRYWHWPRQSAWRHVKQAMETAAITGPQACPKGLRHHFGLMAVASNVPVSLLQRWMGHTRLETTMIYLQARGEEERAFAERMWQDSPMEARRGL